MRVLAIAALIEPLHEIKVLGSVERNRIAIEQIQEQTGVSIVSIRISHQLAVLPDADDVRQIQNCSARVAFALGGSSKISINRASDLDHLTLGLTPVLS